MCSIANNLRLERSLVVHIMTSQAVEHLGSGAVAEKNNAGDRFLTCNGPAIRELRLGRGWTQDDLAEQSGYSRRLIQKAESGGSLAPATLAVLAETLGADKRPVGIENLTVSAVSLVRQFVEAQNTHFPDVAPVVRHLLADDFVMWSAGNPNEIPFAGEHRGYEGLDHFFKQFCLLLTPHPDGFLRNVRYLAEGNEVVCWLQAFAQVAGMDESPPIWVCHRYHIENGKIARFENHFDTQTGAEHLAEARARGLLAEHQQPSPEE